MNELESINYFDAGRWAVTSAPGTEPISRSEAKNYLKIASGITADDTLIDSMIVAARNIVQYGTSKCLITQTITEKRDDFTHYDSFPLALGPVTSITSVSYTDTAGNSQTLSTNVYSYGEFNGVTRLFLKANQQWPQVYNQRNVVSIVYVAGYANAAAVPDELKMAMYQIIADLYENRTDYVKKLPTASDHIMFKHRLKLF